MTGPISNIMKVKNDRDLILIKIDDKDLCANCGNEVLRYTHKKTGKKIWACKCRSLVRA